SYSADLWFFAIISKPTVYIYSGFAISHIVLLAGFIMSHTHKKLEHKENHLLQNKTGFDSSTDRDRNG
ncbi:hypothetical protein IID24_00005, partial [Patescibacteria group bacterium]|nr:hypothetical protein [Patescibacteria group bacterium]